MKICMVFSNPFPPREGIGHHIYYLSQKLIEKGHEVTVITRGNWKKVQRDVIEGIELIRVPFIPIYPFYLKVHGRFVNKIFKLLESDIDLVHFHSPLPPLIKTMRPKVTTIHTPMLTDYRYVKVESIYSIFSKISARFVSYPLELKLIQASDIVMTVANSIAKELNEEYNLPPDQIFVVGNGVDERFFYPVKQKYENDNKYVLFAGHIEREKGLFDLLDSARYICKERSDISFFLAGSGRDFNALKRRISKFGLDDRFILLGQVSKEKLIQLYQNATIFILPSYHEGLSTVLLEAMACALPVISTDVRGNRELIYHGENGILVPSRNPNKLAEAISLFLDDENLRRRTGCNARKFIEKNYTWNKISGKILRCYELALDKQQ